MMEPLRLSAQKFDEMQEAVNAGVATSTVLGVWDDAIRAGWIVKEEA